MLLTWNAVFSTALFLWSAKPALAANDRVILHLRNGDRLAGSVVSEGTNTVVFTTDWNSALTVPLSAIARRENSLAATLTLPAKPKPATAPAATANKFKGSIRLGMDFLQGRRSRQLYYGRTKLEFEHPYQRNPAKHFRTTLDFTTDYGETDGRRSANRMDGGLKADFDTGEQLYLYSLAAGGYDEIRKVDVRYELGSGVGYHLITRPTLKFDAEAGLNYQVQQRDRSRDVDDFNWRFAQRLNWKIAPRFTITENAEFSPRVTDPTIFDARLEANLAYALTDSLSLNVSVLDLYDTQPATDVDRNELQIRSSVGVTF